MGSRGASANSGVPPFERGINMSLKTILKTGVTEANIIKNQAELERIADALSSVASRKAKLHGFTYEKKGDGISASLQAEKTKNGSTIYVNPVLSKGRLEVVVRHTIRENKRNSVRVQEKADVFKSFDEAYKFADTL